MRKLAGVLAALVISGCQCGSDDAFTRVVPKIGIAEATLDFGMVPIGATKRVRFVVKNDGSADLMLMSVDATSPFGATLVDAQLQAGATGFLDVAFTPANIEPASGMLVIHSNDPQQPNVVVQLRGLGIAGNLVVRPTAIDFDATTVGTSRSAEVIVQNIGLVAVDTRLTTDAFERPEHFSLSTLSRFDGAAQLGVPARSDVELVLEYRPLLLGVDSGRIVIEICGERCGLEVTVHATATEATVKLDPPLVDFGTVGIGTRVSSSVTVQNIGTNVLQVLSFAVSGGAELSASSAHSFPATIAAGGSLTIGLDYTPASAAPFMGELSVRTTDPAVPQARVEIRGQGEGPLFIVQPNVLAFGATREMATHRRAFIMLNAGSADVTVRAIRVNGASFSPGDAPGLPARMASGESLTAYVNFAPGTIGEYTGTLEVESDDPANPVVTIPLSGGLTDRLCELGLSSEQVNFGLMPVGYSRNRSETLTNIGTDVCTLTSAAFRAPIDSAITLVSADAFPLTLEPGQQTTMQFNYRPTEEVESKGNYVMLTDDPVYPERHVVLLGSAQGYVDIFVRPQSIDFGQSRIDCTSDAHQVTVFNAGVTDASISAITLTGGSSQIHLAAPGVPARLPAGGRVNIGVTYQPTVEAEETDELQIGVADLPYALIVPLRGEGSANPRAIDAFTQDVSRLVDVLFVIDDSCSMYDEQAQLADNFRAFIEEAEMRAVDFHVGITTTTLFPSPGALVGPVLDANTTALESTFSHQANVGTSGSGVEQGLDAMAGALSLAAAGVAPNSGLLRPDATLFAVIVSDEDDQSAATTVTYLNTLRNNAPAGFLFAAITGQANGCGNFDPNDPMAMGAGAAPAPRYAEFIQLANGLSESICADWTMTLSALGSAAFGLRSRFALGRVVDMSMPIEVRVDGQALDPSEWMYDATDNAVHFGTPPAEGSAIEVEYTPAC